MREADYRRNLNACLYVNTYGCTRATLTAADQELNAIGGDASGIGGTLTLV